MTGIDKSGKASSSLVSSPQWLLLIYAASVCLILFSQTGFHAYAAEPVSEPSKSSKAITSPYIKGMFRHVLNPPGQKSDPPKKKAHQLPLLFRGFQQHNPVVRDHKPLSSGRRSLLPCFIFSLNFSAQSVYIGRLPPIPPRFGSPHLTWYRP